MNAFLQKPIVDYSLISSSPLPIKYIIGKNREQLKLLFFLFYFYTLIWSQDIDTPTDLRALHGFNQHYKMVYSLYVYIFINIYEY